MSRHTYITLGTNPPARATPSAPRGGYYDYSLGDNVLMSDSCTVFEQDKSPLETGLLDANGNRLYRLPDQVRIGFHI